MARIRTIKPQFWTDESVVDLPFEYRLLFIGIWNFADDDGFIENKPKQIKLQVFPGDDVNVASGIRALVKRQMLEPLTLDGMKVLRVRGWKGHQVISRPTPSKFASAYADYQAGQATHGGLTEDSRRTPSGKEGKGRERKGKEVTQVGGGGHLSSDAANDDPAAADLAEPWRCIDHQGVDVPCHGCKAAKARHKQLEAEKAKREKDEARRAEQAARDEARNADRDITPDDGTGARNAIAAVRAAREATTPATDHATSKEK